MEQTENNIEALMERIKEQETMQRIRSDPSKSLHFRWASHAVRRAREMGKPVCNAYHAESPYVVLAFNGRHKTRKR